MAQNKSWFGSGFDFGTLIRTFLTFIINIYSLFNILENKTIYKNKYIPKHQGFQNTPLRVNDNTCFNIQGNS